MHGTGEPSKHILYAYSAIFILGGLVNEEVIFIISDTYIITKCM